MPQGSFILYLWGIFAAALILRIVLAWPALADGATLLRPDSMAYWECGRALAAGDGLVCAPGSSELAVERTVGYPALLALCIFLSRESWSYAGVAGCILSALAVLPVAMAARRVAGERPGLLAGGLYALSISSIAAAPLILADTLLGLLAAWQLYWAVAYLTTQERRLKYFTALTLTICLGALVKPVNLPVIIIGVPIIMLAGFRNTKDLCIHGAVWILMSMVLLGPYWIRNYRICGDYDGNTANIYFHNGSAIMAKATGESSEVWRQRLLDRAQVEFAAHPKKYSSIKERNKWKKAAFAQMIKDYPAATLTTHLPNIFNLLPDVPTLLENNHVTSGERGTMAVLRQQGFAAAVGHYLNGRYYLLIFLLPLLAVHGLIMLLSAIKLVSFLRLWQWRWLLAFGVLVFYYVWAPGPVISPRYLLPALPMLILMSVCIYSKTDKTKTM